jgi:hypothetical protein
MGSIFSNEKNVATTYVLDEEIQSKINVATKHFINDYCVIGPSEVCDNVNVLACAYIEYLRDNLDTSYDKPSYTNFNNARPFWKQKLMHLMQQLHTVILIFNNETYYNTPNSCIMSRKDKDTVIPIEDYDRLFSIHDRSLCGVIGIRLVKFPIKYKYILDKWHSLED